MAVTTTAASNWQYLQIDLSFVSLVNKEPCGQFRAVFDLSAARSLGIDLDGLGTGRYIAGRWRSASQPTPSLRKCCVVASLAMVAQRASERILRRINIHVAAASCEESDRRCRLSGNGLYPVDHLAGHGRVCAQLGRGRHADWAVGGASVLDPCHAVRSGDRYQSPALSPRGLASNLACPASASCAACRGAIDLARGR